MLAEMGRPVINTNATCDQGGTGLERVAAGPVVVNPKDSIRLCIYGTTAVREDKG